MDDPHRCPQGGTPCPSCGSLLAGARKVVVEPLRQEAALVHALLESAVPHPIEPDEPFQRAGGLMVPLSTAFAVFVPEGESDEALQILEDARRAEPETDL